MLFYRKALSSKRKKNAYFEHFSLAFCTSSNHVRLGNVNGNHRCRKVSTCLIFLWFCFTFPIRRIDFTLRILFVWATTFPFALHRRFANVKPNKMNTYKQTDFLFIPLAGFWCIPHDWMTTVGQFLFIVTKFGEKCVWMRSVDKCVRKYDVRNVPKRGLNVFLQRKLN